MNNFQRFFLNHWITSVKQIEKLTISEDPTEYPHYTVELNSKDLRWAPCTKFFLEESFICLTLHAISNER